MILAANISAFSIFLALGAIGFIFLLASLIFGEVFGHGDVAGGHDLGDHGDAHGGASVLSPRVLSVFVTAFGGFGAIGIYEGLSIVASSGIGLAGGVVFGAIIYFFASFLYGQQASSEIRADELLGTTARVSVTIPPGGLGQVRCTIGETAIEKIARSKDGMEIPVNTMVKIDQVAGEMVLVTRAE